MSEFAGVGADGVADGAPEADAAAGAVATLAIALALPLGAAFGNALFGAGDRGCSPLGGASAGALGVGSALTAGAFVVEA